MKQSGECDISIVKNVLTQINELKIKLPCVIKSTIPPGTSKIFNDAFDNLQIIFNPEFLVNLIIHEGPASFPECICQILVLTPFFCSIEEGIFKLKNLII